MEYTRFLDKLNPPEENVIPGATGHPELWNELRTYLDQHYDIVPELVYGGKKYGWCWKYRKGGRTLTCLYPEQGAFTVLVVLGGKEMERHAEILEQLSATTREQLDATHQYHDGKWLWLRVHVKEQIGDVKKLLTIKRKPKK